MMYEVLKRRFSARKEKGDFPDLLVVDGGIGQLNVALEVLRELDIDDVDAVGLAKMRVERAPRAAEVRAQRGARLSAGPQEPGRPAAQLERALPAAARPRRSPPLRHHLSSGAAQRESVRSLLDSIPGVGPTRRRRLLRHFGSVKRIREAAEAEIAEVPGISATLASEIKQYLGGGRRGSDGQGAVEEATEVEIEPSE